MPFKLSRLSYLSLIGLFKNVCHDKVSPSSPGLAAVAAANANDAVAANANANDAAAAAAAAEALKEIKVKHPQRNSAFAQYWRLRAG